MKKNTIHIEGSGNIVINDVKEGVIKIDTNHPHLKDELQKLNIEQIAALQKMVNEQSEKISESFKTILESVASQKNVLQGNISNVNTVYIGDVIQYHYPPPPPKANTIWRNMLFVLFVFAVLCIYAIYNSFKADKTTAINKPETTLQDTLVSISRNLKESPMLSSAFKVTLKEIVDSIQEIPGFERKNPETAALAYRLYAASIILQPADKNTSPLKAVDYGYPWMTRTLTVNYKFSDDKDLRKSIEYLENLLKETPESLPMEELLKNEFRIAMVEAGDEEVNAQVKSAIDAIVAIKGMNEPKKSKMDKKELAAMKLGLSLGGKIILITLPKNDKNRLSPAFSYNDDNLKKDLAIIGMTEPESDKIIVNLQKAFKNPNNVMAASLILDEINKIREFLSRQAFGTRYVSIFRIGISEGYSLECSLVVLSLNPNPGQMVQLESLIKKWNTNLPSDILIANLPVEMTDALNKTIIKLSTVEDIKIQINACKKVLQLVNQYETNTAI